MARKNIIPVIAISVLSAALPRAQADVLYTLFTHPDLIGMHPGLDGGWGTADDGALPEGLPLRNPDGAASFTYDVSNGAGPPQFDPLKISFQSGTFSLAGAPFPSDVFTSWNSTLKQTTGDVFNFGLAPAPSSAVTTTGLLSFSTTLHTVETTFGLPSAIGPTAGITLFNDGLRDDIRLVVSSVPAGFDSAGLITHGTYLKGLLNESHPNWTAVNFDVVCPPTGCAQAAVTVNFSVDPAAVIPINSGSGVFQGGNVYEHPALPDSLFVGDANSGGILSVNGGASAAHSQILIAAGAQDSIGTILVAGAGSQLSATSGTAVGELGDGRLDISAGGRVISNNGSDNFGSDHGSFNVGNGGGSRGLLQVHDVDSVLAVAGVMVIGNGLVVPGFGFDAPTTGTARIFDGGTIALDGLLILGREVGATGNTSVTGPGSAIIYSALDSSGIGRNLSVGIKGRGTLNVTDGGVVTGVESGELGWEAGAEGEINIDGASSALTFSDTDRPLTVGHNGRGRVNVTNGGVVSGLASATIGGGVSGEGVVDVHGTGAALTFAGTDRSLTVAFEGQGALNVTDGGAIGGVGFSNIASEAGAEGVITVDGTDSRFEYSGTNSGFIVGSRGHGTLHVTNGGLVSGAVFGTVSSDTGGEGVVNIGGAGSTLALTGACTGCNFLQGAFLAIGTNGVGTVNVTGGGRVTVDAAGTGAIFPGIAVGGLGITPGSAGTGHLVVDGVGSAITISGDNAYIEVGGNNGQGQVDVTNGAAVRIEGSNASAYLAPLANTAGVAELNVAGAGSQFDAGSLLAIGKDFFTTAGGGSLATVNVSAGGTVAADLIYIGPNGVVSGSGGNLVGDVENHGTLMPGNSPGVLDIDGDLTLGADGTLVIEIAGVIPGLEYDVLNVSGLLTFGGTLELVFLNEFLPSPNDPTFRFFNATNTLGNFAEILLPSGFNLNLDSNGGFQINAVPLPPAALLLMPALMVLAARRRRSGRPNANRGQTRMAFT